MSNLTLGSIQAFLDGQNAPAFRTNPAKTAEISTATIVAGYLMAIVWIPVLLCLVGFLITPIIGHLALPEVLPKAVKLVVFYFFAQFFLLAVSPIYSWAGALMSLPLVYLTRRYGFAGWATAMLVGALAGMIVVSVLDPFSLFHASGNTLGNLAFIALPSAMLGLFFWLTVRTHHPNAFARDAA